MAGQKIGYTDLLLAILGLLLYVFDVGSDIYAAVTYAREAHYAWMSLTTLCIYLPRVVSFLFFYLIDLLEYYEEISKDKSDNEKLNVCRLCITHLRSKNPVWLLVFLPGSFELFMLMLHFIYLHFLCTELKRNSDDTEDKPNNTSRMLNIFTIIEAAFEAAPQFILQMHIIIKFGFGLDGGKLNNRTYQTLSNASLLIMNDNITTMTPNVSTQEANSFIDSVVPIGITGVIRILGIIASLLSVSWTVTKVYFTNAGDLLAGMERVLPPSAQGKLIQLLWRTFMVAPRLLALSFFASRFGLLFLLFFVFHSAALFVIETVMPLLTNGAIPFMPIEDRIYSSLISNLDFVEFDIKAMYVILVMHYMLLYVEDAIVMLVICLKNCFDACQFEDGWYYKAGLAAVLGLPVFGGIFLCLFHYQFQKKLKRDNQNLRRMETARQRINSLALEEQFRELGNIVEK